MYLCHFHRLQIYFSQLSKDPKVTSLIGKLLVGYSKAKLVLKSNVMF